MKRRRRFLNDHDDDEPHRPQQQVKEEAMVVEMPNLPRRAPAKMCALASFGLATLVGLLMGRVLVLAMSYTPAASSATGQQQHQQSMAQLLQVFNGNESQQLDNTNHFKLMEREGEFLLLGARNVVYNLSLSTMREHRRLEWPSSEDDVKMCRVKGKSPEQCQNYIRVLKLQSPDTLFVCGTNAYKPRCRTYLITSNAYELVSEAPGEGACPYQENQNVTSLFADGDLYSATAAQFSGFDGLIHRAPLRTEQFNPKQLNSPNFVSSFRYGEHVYFLFRESAIEHINCGKTIYSRIARVCINDSGGQTRANRERWTSFVKARLNCSIPGEYPFYFDEIQASTHIMSSANSSPKMSPPITSSGNQQTTPITDLLYAVFTTPTNSIGGSAVCAFRMSDVLAAFDGPFKSQADGNSNWLPVPESRVPQPRPGTCVNDSKRLPDENINFIKDNPLMDTAIEAVWSQPLIMMASINFRFTQIAVDPQVETQLAPGASSMRTDVIFVSTDDGRVFKLINTHHLYSSTQRGINQPQYPLTIQPYYIAAARQQPQLDSYGSYRAPVAAPQTMAGLISSQGTNREPPPDVSSSTIVIEELHLFDSRTPILNTLIYYPPITADSSQHPKLIVLSGKQLKAIPLSRCERAISCADCLALYDPYCAWDTRHQACMATGRSVAPGAYPHLTPRHSQQSNWFPPNNLANNHTLAWWSQCPASSDQLVQQQVGAPFRSLFSSHIQVPNRFDYASGHHLSHTALVSLSAPSQSISGQQFSLYRQQPVSECLTFCGGLYIPQQISGQIGQVSGESSGQQQLMMNCADLVQQHYIGNPQSPPLDGASRATGNLYTSENLYFAVIICAVSGLILGLVFGFAIGRNTRKHDSSICSSTFDETNLYMASTGSHHGANLFAQQQQQQQQRLHHPLLQQSAGNGLLSANSNGVRPSLVNQPNNHLFEASQCLLHETTPSNYGNQQQMLLHLTGSGNGNGGNNINNSNNSINNAPTRNGALPPVPLQQGPLVSTSTSSTHINHSQLTPNSITNINHPSMSSGSASSTNTSSTSATVPVSDHHHQMYLNQQQLMQQTHQRSFTNASSKSSSTGKGSGRLMDPVNKSSNGKNATFLQQQSQLQLQLQQQQQNNKIYL